MRVNTEANRRTGIIKIFLFAAVLVAVFAYAAPAGAIYGGGYSQIPAVGRIGIGSTNGDINRPQILCSGTLIAPSLVLTSANCFTNVPHGSIINFWPYSNISYRAPAIDFAVFTYAEPDEIALVKLTNPIPSYIATPIPPRFISDLDGFVGLLAGFGPPCPVVQCGPQELAQRAVSAVFPNSNNICNGGYGVDNDAGGPFITNALEKVSGVLTAGYCGQRGGRDEIENIYRYNEVIREYVAENYGPPFCTAAVRYDSSVHKFYMIFIPYKTGNASCSWTLDGNASSGTVADCLPLSAPIFNESSLLPGTHRVVFTVQDSYGTSYCETPAFSVSVPPGYPQFVISPQNPSAAEGAPVRLDVQSVICEAGPCATQWMLPSQARISGISPSSQSFASIGLSNGHLSSFLANMLKLIPLWRP